MQTGRAPALRPAVLAPLEAEEAARRRDAGGVLRADAPGGGGADALGGGFTDAPVQSAHVFRATLAALSRPGAILRVTGAAPPAPLSAAAGAPLLALTDATTPPHLAGAADCALVRDWVTFHCGAALAAADQAMCALGDWAALQPVDRFAVGAPEYPDRAATLIVEAPSLAMQGARLNGPGIRDAARSAPRRRPAAAAP